VETACPPIPYNAIAAFTCEVLAALVPLSVAKAVGTFGDPVNVGLSTGAAPSVRRAAAASASSSSVRANAVRSAVAKVSLPVA